MWDKDKKKARNGSPMQDSHDMWNANFGNFVFQTPPSPPPPPPPTQKKKKKKKEKKKKMGFTTFEVRWGNLLYYIFL